MIKTFLLNTSFLHNEESYNFFYDHLLDEHKLVVDSYKNKNDQVLKLGNYLLTHLILNQFDIDSKNISYTEANKPYILNSPYKFNVSHKGDLVALSFGSSEVGIDIEHLSSIHPRLKDIYFTEEERKYVESSKDEERAALLIWTIKESVTKCLGHPESIIFNSFNINPKQNYCKINDTTIYYKIYYLNNYIIVASSLKNRFKEKIIFV